MSDRIGRKPLVIAGCLIACFAYFPIFKAVAHYANPALVEAGVKAPAQVSADPETCSFQFNPVGAASFTSACDIAKAALARNSINYVNIEAAPGSGAFVRVGDVQIDSFDGSALDTKERATQIAAFNAQVQAALDAAGYPAKADPARINKPMIVLLLIGLGVLAVMTYAPVAALLVELFPARIRYTAMSIPYHAGNGWIGGLLPPTAFALVAASGSSYAGLWYPLAFSAATVVIGMLFLPETRGAKIDEDV